MVWGGRKTIAVVSALIAVAVIQGSGASDYITEEFLVEEYDKNFPEYANTVDRESKIAIMDNILNTVPIKIPFSDEQKAMGERVGKLLEKREQYLVKNNMHGVDDIDGKIDELKPEMAKLGMTLPEDSVEGNKWYELSRYYAKKNAMPVPEQEKKFKLIPDADASSKTWNVYHELQHSCAPLDCTNIWHERVSSEQWSHVSVDIDTVVWPYSITLKQGTDNISWSFKTATTHMSGSLTSGNSIIMYNYRTNSDAYIPFEAEGPWIVLDGYNILSLNDDVYSSVKVVESS